MIDSKILDRVDSGVSLMFYFGASGKYSASLQFELPLEDFNLDLIEFRKKFYAAINHIYITVKRKEESK